MTDMSSIEKLAAFYPEVGELLAERDNLADDVRRRAAEAARVYRELHTWQSSAREWESYAKRRDDELDRLRDPKRIFGILSPHYGGLTNSAIEDITAKLIGEA